MSGTHGVLNAVSALTLTLTAAPTSAPAPGQFCPTQSEHVSVKLWVAMTPEAIW